ncbi:MAG: CBS domain-containing protein [bacterium]
MELPIVGLIVLIGALASLITSVISELSHDKLNNITEKRGNQGDIIVSLRQKIDYNLNPFILIEIFWYSTAGFLLGVISPNFRIFPTLPVILSSITIILIYFVIIILVRHILKGIGARYAEVLVDPLKGLIQIYYYSIYPVYFISSLLTKSVIAGKVEDDSRDEIDHLVETAYSEKSIDRDEYKILKNAINFSDVMAKEVMTPKTVIFSLNINEKIDDIIKIPELQNYTRIPVWEGKSIDDGVKGYVLTRDIYHAALIHKFEGTTRDFLRDINFVFENESLDNVLEMFLKKRKHMFIVVDEYGGIAGLISMEDVLEYILGEEIVDEVDNIVDMRLHAKHTRDKRIISSEDCERKEE